MTNAEYLFLSPEQLANDEVVDALAELDLSLFVVDEAHCVSAWGMTSALTTSGLRR